MWSFFPYLPSVHIQTNLNMVHMEGFALLDVAPPHRFINTMHNLRIIIINAPQSLTEHAHGRNRYLRHKRQRIAYLLLSCHRRLPAPHFL